MGHPRYRRRKNGGSLRWNGGSLQVVKLNSKWGAVRIPKEGSWLRFRLSRELPTPSGVTLRLTPSGEYHVSFVVQH